VNHQWEEGYKKALEKGQLEPNLLLRSSSFIRDPEDKLGDIKTSNLILVFSEFNFCSASANRTETIIAAIRKHQLQIPYALFNRESDSYRFVDQNCVDVSSEDTVGFLHDIVRTHIECIPPYNKETGYHIAVYKVR